MQKNIDKKLKKIRKKKDTGKTEAKRVTYLQKSKIKAKKCEWGVSISVNVVYRGDEYIGSGTLL